MTLLLRTYCHVVPAAILFSATATMAAEPSHVDSSSAVPATSNEPPAVESPAAGASTDSRDVNSASATTADPQAAGTSPNSVEPSPYGAAEPAPPAAVAAPLVATPAERDIPATLFDADYAIGGFGGLGASYTRFAGSDRPLACGEAAVIIDHAFTLGGGGCGIPTRMNGQKYGPGEPNSGDRLHFGYGGAIVRYHFFSRRAVNFAVGTLVGAGAVEVSTWNGQGDESDFGNYTSKSSADALFVVEPQIGVYANLRRWLRVCALGGYRFASGVDTKGLANRDIMGPTFGGQIQGGWF